MSEILAETMAWNHIIKFIVWSIAVVVGLSVITLVLEDKDDYM